MAQETIRYSDKILFKSNQIGFGRVMSKAGLSDEIVDCITQLSNLSLPKEYHRLEPSYFTQDSINAGKTIYDVSSQWQGNAYLALRDNDNIVGFCIGNLFSERNQLKGFGRLVVVEDSIRKEGVGRTLMYLMVKGFLYQGVEEIRGSTSTMNAPLRSIAERFPVLKSLNLSWVRYSISSKKAEQILSKYENQYPQVKDVWEQLK